MSGFDRIAPFYSGLEYVCSFGSMRRCRNSNLQELRGDERVLCLGEGNGLFLRDLIQHHPGIRVVCVDFSGQMLDRARRRVPEGNHIEFIQADVLASGAGFGAFDAVIANFFFDCFAEPQLRQVAKSAARSLRPGGRLLLADFRIPARGIARISGSVLIGGLYRLFKITCGLENRELVPPESSLEQAGFRMSGRKISCQGLLHADVWEMKSGELHSTSGPIRIHC